MTQLELSHPFFFVSVGIADTVEIAAIVDITGRGHVPCMDGITRERRKIKIKI